MLPKGHNQMSKPHPAPPPAFAFVQPRLVLHIEVDTISELMRALEAFIGDFDTALVGHIAVAPGEAGDRASADIHIYGSSGEADKAATAVARPRGRPRKATTQDAPSTPGQANVAAFEPLAGPISPPPTETGDGAAALGLVSPPVALADPQTAELSPADARTKGIEMVQKHYVTHPASLPAITAIQTKFVVAQFSAIADDKAHQFLADVMMLVNGTGAV
jgi:hypothetical protein